MPAQFWKWRLQGGAVSIARMIDERALQPDFLLVSDMVDLSTLRALTAHSTARTPTALYFHETQLTYPQNARQSHGWRYGFINYISALSADAVYFNSQYHHDVFFKTLPNMLKHFGDYNELQTVEIIREKSTVLPLGLALKRFDAHRPAHPSRNERPLIVWNHRWEADKNPTAFVEALYRLDEDGLDFEVAIIGQNVRQSRTEFDECRVRLAHRIRHFGYLPDFASYADLLWRADYVVSTAHQEFFGGAIAEALYCGCVPILPDRLNYPALLPPDQRDACLYRGDNPRHCLMAHLRGEHDVDSDALRAHISRYDWQAIAPQYDATFAAYAPASPN